MNAKVADESDFYELNYDIITNLNIIGLGKWKCKNLSTYLSFVTAIYRNNNIVSTNSKMFYLAAKI